MRTSFTHPLYISWVPFEGDKGCLGLTLCPGKYQPVSSTGSWDRQLEVDLQSLVDQGVTRLITLITDDDMDMLRVQELPTFVWQYGLEWHHLPLVDTTVPTDEWMEQAIPVFETLLQTIPEGEKAVVHCMGGLSRAGTFASLFLWMKGMEMKDAIATIREKRSPHAINWRQERFLHRFARDERTASFEPSIEESMEDNGNNGDAMVHFYRPSFTISCPEENILLELREEGNQALELKRYEDAKVAYEEGIEKSIEFEHHIAHACFLNNLALVTEKIVGPNEALEFLDESLQISHRVHYTQGIEDALSNIGMIFSQNQCFEQALEYLQNALSTAAQHGDAKCVEWIEDKIQWVQQCIESQSSNTSTKT